MEQGILHSGTKLVELQSDAHFVLPCWKLLKIATILLFFLEYVRHYNV